MIGLDPHPTPQRIRTASATACLLIASLASLGAAPLAAASGQETFTLTAPFFDSFATASTSRDPPTGVVPVPSAAAIADHRTGSMHVHASAAPVPTYSYWGHRNSEISEAEAHVWARHTLSAPASQMEILLDAFVSEVFEETTRSWYQTGVVLFAWGMVDGCQCFGYRYVYPVTEGPVSISLVLRRADGLDLQPGNVYAGLQVLASAIIVQGAIQDIIYARQLPLDNGHAAATVHLVRVEGHITYGPPPPPNQAPEAQADAYATSAGSTLVVSAPGVLGNDADGDGDPLTAVLATGPSSGSLSLSDDGSFSYSPNAGFSGTDAFTYRASDGKATSAPATVTITVNPPPPQRGVGVSPAAESKTVALRGTATYDITITNTGNAADTILLTKTEDSGGWKAALSTSSLTLAAGASSTVQLSVKAPNKEATFSVTVTAASQADPGKTAQATATTTSKK